MTVIQPRTAILNSRRKTAPPERMKISEWAERYRVLSPESCSEPGRWSNERTPYMIAIMDAINDPEVEEITVMTSSQVGKSELVINIIMYFIDKEPCPILLLCPTLDFAENYSRKRIAPALRDCKSIAGKIAESKSRDSANTLLYKEFPGGNITLAGSNSPASLSSHPIRLFIVEELDRTETTSEGDSVALGEKRTNNYYNRKKIKVSTPTLKNLSKIAKSYARSSQEKYHIPCPLCNHFQTLKFAQVLFKDAEGNLVPKIAKYRCEKCSQDWSESQRYEAIKKGKWIASNPENKKHRGFGKLNELYSLWRTLEQIVTDFLEKKDNPETLQVFVNTTLGEEFEITGAAPAWEKLYARREAYRSGFVPKRGVFLTAGIDVQEDRLHCEVIAWGRNFETWSIAYMILWGDTASETPWKALEIELERLYPCEDGRKIGISKACIDANYNTQEVLKFARQYSASQLVPIIGRDGQRTIVSLPQRIDVRGNHKYGQLKLHVVGSSTAKKELYGFLRQQQSQSGSYPFGYAHFPQDYSEQYFMELTAEEVKKKKDKNGFPVYYWEKIRDRNEALDCRVYNRGAAYLLGIDRFSEDDWTRLEAEQAPGISKRKIAVTVEQRKVEAGDYDSVWN